MSHAQHQLPDTYTRGDRNGRFFVLSVLTGGTITTSGTISVAAGGINGNHIAFGAVNGNHIAAGSVGGNHIADLSIGGNDVAFGALNRNHLGAGTCVTDVRITDCSNACPAGYVASPGFFSNSACFRTCHKMN